MKNTDLEKDKLLFTPGPLTTSATIKNQMLRDLGSRDTEFIEIVKEVRERLINIAGVDKSEFDSIILQGSGTYGLESVVTSVIRETDRFLIIINGAYGERVMNIADRLKLDYYTLGYQENQIPDLDEIDSFITAKNITHVEVVHCETTTGIMNPIKEIGKVVKKHGCVYIVDAMSSFGCVNIDMKASGIDFLISSSNKCLEGVPGFSFVIAKKEELLKCKGVSRSLSLDIFDQWVGLEKNGQFRYTPPIQVIMAFKQALVEFEEEGGVEGRSARYITNHKILLDGMRRLGFKEYIPDNLKSHIITSFLFPEDESFSFNDFYNRLSEKGFVIYPGKLSKVNCFRIGNIGRIFQNDMLDLLAAVEETIIELQIKL